MPKPNTKNFPSPKPEGAGQEFLPHGPLEYVVVETTTSQVDLELVLTRASGLELRLHTALPKQGSSLTLLVFERPAINTSGMSRGQVKDALLGF